MNWRDELITRFNIFMEWLTSFLPHDSSDYDDKEADR